MLQRFIFLVVCIGIIGGVFYARQRYGAMQIERESAPFVTSAAREITQGWSAEAFRKYADNALAAQPAINDAFAGYRRLGAVTRPADCIMTESQGHRYRVSSGNYFTASYDCHAAFAAGPATLKVGIYRYQNEPFWKINSFNVVSPAFMR